MAIFRQGKRVGPFDIRLGLPRGKEYDNIPGDPRIKQRAKVCRFFILSTLLYVLPFVAQKKLT